MGCASIGFSLNVFSEFSYIKNSYFKKIIRIYHLLCKRPVKGYFVSVWCMVDFFDEYVCRCTGNPLLTYG